MPSSVPRKREDSATGLTPRASCLHASAGTHHGETAALGLHPYLELGPDELEIDTRVRYRGRLQLNLRLLHKTHKRGHFLGYLLSAAHSHTA